MFVLGGEADRGISLAVGLGGTEVGTLALKAGDSGNKIRWEQLHCRVVVLNGLVVTAAFLRDTVLGVSDLVLQARDILAFHFETRQGLCERFVGGDQVGPGLSSANGICVFEEPGDRCCASQTARRLGAFVELGNDGRPSLVDGAAEVC